MSAVAAAVSARAAEVTDDIVALLTRKIPPLDVDLTESTLGYRLRRRECSGPRTRDRRQCSGRG